MTEQVDRAPIAFAALCLLVMSATVAALLAIMRLPFETPPASTMVRAFLFLGAVFFTWHALSRREWASPFVLPGACLGTFAAFFGLPILGSLPWVGFLADVAMAAIWIAVLPATVRDLRGAPPWQWGTLVAVGLALGVLYFVLFNGRNVATFFTPEFTALSMQRRDTLFHAAVAAMIAKFGVVSSGLDGLVLIKYHFLSHAWFGFLAGWLGISTIEAYYLGAQTIAIPLLFFAVAVAVHSVWRPRAALAFAPLLVIAPLAGLSLIDLHDLYDWLISESQFMALIVLLFSLPVLAQFALTTPVPAWPFYGTFAIVTPLMALAKVSMGAVWAAGLFYLIVRKQRPRLQVLAPLMLGVCVLGGALAWFTMSSGHVAALQFEWLEYFKSHTGSLEKWGAIGVLSAFAASLLIGYARWDRATRALAETFAICCVAALVPTMTLRIAGGSAYYFLNAGAWIALVWVVGKAALPLMHHVGRPALWVAATTAVGIAAVVATPFKREAVGETLKLFQLFDKRLEAGGAACQSLGDLRCLARWRDALAQRYRGSDGDRMVATFRRSGVLGSRDTVVYVPPGFTAFWRAHERCEVQAMTIPALFGLPLINGLPPKELGCDLGDYYGYLEYSASAHSVAMTNGELCAKARFKGFSRVLVFSSYDQAELLTCPA